MAKKTNKKAPVVREEDTEQAQSVLAQYQKIARELQKSFSADQAKEALAAINGLTETAQIAFLKLLATEHNATAANVLLAAYELSDVKSSRKEARRGLIQLEGTRIYPNWRVPTNKTSPYRIVDAADSMSSGDSVETSWPDAITDVILDEDEADEEDFDDDSEDVEDFHDLSPREVVSTFVERWAEGSYYSAFSLLTEESLLRGGLSAKEWVKRREEWDNRAVADHILIDYVQEVASQLSADSAASSVIPTQTIEMGWSVVLQASADEESLPELPHATLVYPATGRHWFWTRYVLDLQEDGAWLIESMIDEGLKTLNIPTEELRQRLEEHKRFFVETTKDLSRDNLEEVTEYAKTNYALMIEMVYYYDVLVTKLPEDLELCEEASVRMLQAKLFERAMAYMSLMAERFPEVRAEVLPTLAKLQRKYSEVLFEQDEDDYAMRFTELAQNTLREVIAIDSTFDAHVTLADWLIADYGDDLDEAEEHLLQAKALSTSSTEIATVEVGLGKIDMEREEFEDALAHFQQAIEAEPEMAVAWLQMARAYDVLENVEEAEKSYLHAIELQPDDENSYFHLSLLYQANQQNEKAIEILRKGIEALPNSTQMLLHLVSLYLDMQDYEQATLLIEKAAQIDPEMPMLEMFRDMLASFKALAARRTPTQPASKGLPQPLAAIEKPIKPFQAHNYKSRKKKRK